MSARPRQVKSLGKPFLFGCAAVLSLPLKNDAAGLAATNDVNRLKPYQAITTNTPPLSPEIFNPDPNAVEWPPLPQTDFRWTQRVVVSSNAPPASPEIFNPDPGAGLRPQTNAPARAVHRADGAADFHAAADSAGPGVAARRRAAGGISPAARSRRRAATAWNRSPTGWRCRAGTPGAN